MFCFLCCCAIRGANLVLFLVLFEVWFLIAFCLEAFGKQNAKRRKIFVLFSFPFCFKRSLNAKQRLGRTLFGTSMEWG